MIFGPKFSPWLSAVLCGVILCGCDARGPGLVDEEKEPQFLIGRSRVNAMNFRGAIEAFEQALEMNPHSGKAHFELGWLYAEKEADPAAAIYHYQKYLKLRPNAHDAEIIRQHVFRLKQELAKGILPIPPTPELQRQLEQLAEEKRRLQEEVDRLRQALAQSQALTNRPVQTARNTLPVSGGVSSGPEATRAERTGGSSSTPKIYQVRQGDTLVSIAHQHNVRLEALMAANPRLDPRRMRVGETIKIPAR